MSASMIPSKACHIKRNYILQEDGEPHVAHNIETGQIWYKHLINFYIRHLLMWSPMLATFRKNIYMKIAKHGVAYNRKGPKSGKNSQKQEQSETRGTLQHLMLGYDKRAYKKH